MSFALADTSTTRSNFIIAGCSLNNGQSISVGACSSDGRFFCPSNGEELDTIDDEFACSYGNSVYSVGDPQCCPATHYCGPNSGGDLVCLPRTTNCEGITVKSECDSNLCFWVDTEARCYSNPREFGCSFYKDEANCTADPLNLGMEGEGTDVCGEYTDEIDTNGDGIPELSYLVPTESCLCEWNDQSGCNLTYSIYPEVFGIGTSYDFFNCSKHFDYGDCIDYQRMISWNALAKDISEFDWNSGDVPSDLLGMTLCEYGEQTRSCGKPLIQMPSFSIFAFVASLLLITAIYCFKKIGNLK